MLSLGCPESGRRDWFGLAGAVDKDFVLGVGDGRGDLQARWELPAELDYLMYAVAAVAKPQAVFVGFDRRVTQSYCSHQALHDLVFEAVEELGAYMAGYREADRIEEVDHRILEEPELRESAVL